MSRFFGCPSPNMRQNAPQNMGAPENTQSDFGFRLDGRSAILTRGPSNDFTRIGIANEFLSITATELIFQLAVDTTTAEPPQ